MEVVGSPQGRKQNLHIRMNKSSSNGNKDLFLLVRDGSVADVEIALQQLKKNGGNINWRNTFGLTPLHIATWRNHVPIVKRLLAAGADPDARDGESGWTSLHRALHFGHLAVASLLLQCGASITLEDSKLRTPVDLLSGPVSQVLGEGQQSATEVFSWGSGANYQLGTGNAHIQKLPCIVDSLHGSHIRLISAAKFHSVAVSTRGELYTWGFGRGGRLGHPEFDIHSGQAAVITPRRVISGLGSRRVKAVAAAKHHTVVATESGEVFTWGSNREGQLGYTSIDTQPTPRRVSSLKSKIVAVSAANKHTAVVSDAGDVFTWGCNKYGQLGYGTSNSGSNYTPRAVECLKGKVFTGVSAAKYHTVVLGADGEVYTWGHRLVNPRRVVIARNLKKNGSFLMKFHRMERLHVVSVAAGTIHSLALTDDGALFYWVSSDPDLKCQQLYSCSGSKMEAISAGKYWSSAVTSNGDVYMWDGKKSKDKPPSVTRLHGVKRATSVSVGETHLLVVSSVYHPAYPLDMAVVPAYFKPEVKDNDLSELDEGLFFSDMEGEGLSSSLEKDGAQRVVPSLKSLCEKVAAQYIVEPRNALTLLEISDSLGADDLRRHCEEIVIRNLDYVFTVSSNALASAPLDVLARLEKLLDTKSSEPWSNRQLPTPTATFPAIIDSEGEDDNDYEYKPDFQPHRIRGDNDSGFGASNKAGNPRSSTFIISGNDMNPEISKQVRAWRKKLQQIEVLEAKQAKGHPLDDQQLAKLQSKPVLETTLAQLGASVDTSGDKELPSGELGGKGANKDTSRKQRKKSKQRGSKPEDTSGKPQDSVGFEVSRDAVKLRGQAEAEGRILANPIDQDSFICFQKSHALNMNMMKANNCSNNSSSKKKSRKGGLSMFLNGDLDIPQKVIVAPPPPPPKNEGPAWGGAKISKVSSTLREIQDEQSKTDVVVVAAGGKDNSLDKSNGGKIRLTSFIASKPIPLVAVQPPSQGCDGGERSTPPWNASGTPPSARRPSLRDIQLQQGKHIGHPQSPKVRTSGFTVNTGQGSPSDSGGSCRWYKPEIDSPSSIRSIQIEEKAMKDLRCFYKSVKLVKNQS